VESEIEIHVTPRERATLLASVLIIAICALTYELIVGALSSYLLGNSITQFSLTIGLFLFAMGVGSWVSRRIKKHEIRWFILIEILVGVLGGFSATILYAVFAATDIYYYTVMIFLVLSIGTCVGLEIPLLTRIVANKSSLSRALADVLSVDYFGSLVASLAFPIILLPLIGVTRTALLMGIFNLIVAGLILNLFRPRIPQRVFLTFGGMTALFTSLMIGVFVLSNPIIHFLEQQLYDDPIVYREQSRYQRIIITSRNRDVRLYLDGNLQFSSLDEYRYHELLVHPVMSIPRAHEKVLVLGGGDGFVARELLKYDDVQEIIVVDLDPAITDLARENTLLKQYNGDAMNDSRVTIVNQDAYTYIQESDQLFSVIIIDLPDPNNESLGKLYSEQFYRMLRSRLTPDGAFITQATSPYFSRQAFWCIAKTIETGDFRVLPLRTYVPSFGEWGFVIGTPTVPPEVHVPEGIPLRYLTPEVLQAAQFFDPDVDRVEVEVSTLDDPIVIRYYERGWERWN
jgi:spermidine synthase